jgi:hypothetical protein
MTILSNMNLLDVFVTLQGFLLFAHFFLYVNQENPVRHVILAFYAYLFYVYLTTEPVLVDPDNLRFYSSMMCNHFLIADMKPENDTHSQFM